MALLIVIVVIVLIAKLGGCYAAPWAVRVIKKSPQW